MSVIIKLISIALIAFFACFIYVAIMKPATFSFMGMQFGSIDDRYLAKRADLERIEDELKRLNNEISELQSDQSSVIDRIEAMTSEYVGLSNNTDFYNDAISAIDRKISELISNQKSVDSQLNDINTAYVDSLGNIENEVERFTISILDNISYVNMFPHDLVAVMGTSARDPLETIDEHVSYIARFQPDIFNYPGVYVCPQSDSSHRTWNLVYGDYTSSTVAGRIRFMTEKLHKKIKQRPAYPFPKYKYHNKDLNDVCVDGREWTKLDRTKKIEIVCNLDNNYQISPLYYCENDEKQ